VIIPLLDAFNKPVTQWAAALDNSPAHAGYVVNRIFCGNPWSLVARHVRRNFAPCPGLNFSKKPVIETKTWKYLGPHIEEDLWLVLPDGCADNEKLSEILHKLDEPSLSHLLRDHDAGRLEQICRD
jgi:hypothetical protein